MKKRSKKDKWREVYQEVMCNLDGRDVCIKIETPFRLKTQFTDEEESKLYRALDCLEEIIIDLRRRKKGCL